MGHSRFAGEEIGRRGQEIYEHLLQSTVETEANIGKIISIDIETGDYAIAEDLVSAGRLLQTTHPDAAIYGRRIGYNAVYALGGSVVRTRRLPECEFHTKIFRSTQQF